jgi:hypothetical protein
MWAPSTGLIRTVHRAQNSVGILRVDRLDRDAQPAAHAGQMLTHVDLAVVDDDRLRHQRR